MKTLSELDLAFVTGAAGSPSANPSSDNKLSCALQGIRRSLDELGKHNHGGFCGNNALLFMTMAFAFSRRSQFVVYSGNCRPVSRRGC